MSVQEVWKTIRVFMGTGHTPYEEVAVFCPTCLEKPGTTVIDPVLGALKYLGPLHNFLGSDLDCSAEHDVHFTQAWRGRIPNVEG